MIERQGLPNGTAGGMADEGCPLDPEVFKQRRHICGHLLDRVCHVSEAGLAAPPMIVEDDLEVGRQVIQMAMPKPGPAAKTGDHQQGRSVPVDFVVDLVAVGQRGKWHGRKSRGL